MTDPVIQPDNNQKKPLENMVSSSELSAEGASPAVEDTRNAQMEVVHSVLQPSSIEPQAQMSVIQSPNQINEVPSQVPTVIATPTPAAREIQAHVEAGIAQIKQEVVETQLNAPVIPEATVINIDFLLSKEYPKEEIINHVAKSPRGKIINLFKEIGEKSPYDAVEGMKVLRPAYVQKELKRAA